MLCPLSALALVSLVAVTASGHEAPVGPRLREALEHGVAGKTQPIWVFFRDKGTANERPMSEAGITVRALSRRALRGAGSQIDAAQDAPLPRAYVEAVGRLATRVRNESRWFNAVSVDATPAQVAQLRRLAFVERLDVVRRLRRGGPEDSVPAAAGASSLSAAPQAQSELAFDYGASLFQLAQINVPAVHDLGLHGEGVIVAIFDAGFDNLAHETLQTLTILTRRDFVNGDDDVGDGLDMGEGSHGTATLSTIGGYKPGALIGPAFGAAFVLAKTENTASEMHVEEDNWAAAAEWAESLGADVISSSLGYLEFDAPGPSYSYADMNGDIAMTTRAAELAAARGVVVVNSAGNSGFDPTNNTLGAPADGRRVLTVGAVTSFGERADFSSVGPTADGRVKPDVMAQGVFVRVAAPGGPSSYALVNGTSFSCPLTAGVVALVLQAHPTYTVDQVLSLMRSTARNAAAPNNLIGWGIVDALAAVTAPAPPAAQ